MKTLCRILGHKFDGFFIQVRGEKIVKMSFYCERCDEIEEHIIDNVDVECMGFAFELGLMNLG